MRARGAPVPAESPVDTSPVAFFGTGFDDAGKYAQPTTCQRLKPRIAVRKTSGFNPGFGESTGKSAPRKPCSAGKPGARLGPRRSDSGVNWTGIGRGIGA